MKLHWKTFSLFALMASMSAPLMAQKEKDKDSSPKEITVQVTAKESESGQEGSKKSNVAVVTVDGSDSKDVLEQVKKQLESSKVGEEQKAKILDSLKAALASKKEGDGTKKSIHLQVQSNKDGDHKDVQSDIQLEVKSDVILLDRDGKQQKVQLRQMKPTGGKAWLGSLDSMVGDKIQGAIDEQVKNKVKEKLKDSGVDEKTIDKVMATLDSSLVRSAVAGGMSTARTVKGLPLSGGDRFVLGIALEGSDGDDKEAGLVVQSIFDDSPAAKAGLKVDDIVRKVDGKRIDKVDQLIAVVQEAGKEGRKIKILVDRDGKEKEFDVMPKKEASTLSVVGQELPEELKKALEGISGGEMKGFVLPGNAQGAFRMFSPGSNDKAVEDLREQLDDLKAELKELKSMLKDLKSK